MNSYTAFPKGLKASGYYLIAIRNEDGDILELRILKNNLTKWFAMNIGLYLLSRGRYYVYNGEECYVVTPVLKVYREGGTNYWALDENVPIHKIVPPSTSSRASGGGFGGYFYLVSSEPIVLGPPRVCATTSCPEYKIKIIDNGNTLRFHEYIGNAPIEYLEIPAYMSNNRILNGSGGNIFCYINSNYVFTTSFDCKYILIVSGGRFATFTYTDEQNELKYSCANILAFKTFVMHFEAGTSISLWWTLRLSR